MRLACAAVQRVSNTRTFSPCKPIIRQDIALKHTHMAEASFPFFRATFYRWIQLWPEVCGDLAKAPAVLAVGDLHVENFGTWRDEEGRLIWGVNDLDEAWPASYALDLVRLTTSAYLAISAEHLSLTRREAAEAIEEGYRDALTAGGKAFVLAEHHQWLRLLALSKLRDPVRFWEKMQQCPPLTAKPPAAASRSSEADRGFPSPTVPCIPIEAPYCRAGKSGTPPDFGLVFMARRIHCPRSQRNPHICLGLVPRHFFRTSLRRETGWPRHPRQGSLRAFSRALAGSAAGAGLFAHRTGFPAQRKG